MESHFHIEGLPPFDGDHPIDLSYFTNAELRTIKRLAGVRAGELEEAVAAGDNDLLVCFAVIALERAGRTMDEQAINLLWAAPAGKIVLVAGDEEEAGAGPPEPSPSGREQNANAGEKTGSSGPPSRTGGDDHPESPPSVIGSPASATGADSAPVTLRT